MAEFDAKTHYSKPEIVAQATRWAAELGLWKSEEIVLQRLFRPEQALLNVACEAGRISFGLWELGYRQILGIDVARPLIESARLLAAKLEYATPFRVADPSRLGFGAEAFDGVIWSGGRIADLSPEAQATALAGLRRVTRAQGRLLVVTPEGGPSVPSDFAEIAGKAGWQVEEQARRSEIAREPNDVAAAYPDDVRFWTLRRE